MKNRAGGVTASVYLVAHLILEPNVQVKGRPRHADVPVSEANDLNRLLCFTRIFQILKKGLAGLVVHQLPRTAM